ncbi:hypothetical protein VTN02DRAFT_6652 [Thermoascus thermophilus]
MPGRPQGCGLRQRSAPSTPPRASDVGSAALARTCGEFPSTAPDVDTLRTPRTLHTLRPPGSADGRRRRSRCLGGQHARLEHARSTATSSSHGLAIDRPQAEGRTSGHDHDNAGESAENSEFPAGNGWSPKASASAHPAARPLAHARSRRPPWAAANWLT